VKAIYDIPAPAKLNLFLHVTGRRADGYHLLQSVFMLIDWHDTLHVELRQGGQLSREDLGIALPPEDLTLRAARALQQATGTPLGAHIGVLKRVPSEAGMGGGSSDAASCLLALNRLWKLNLTVRELSTIGLALGADVPFFLFGRNAWVEGIGESLQAVTLPPERFLVVKPTQGLETARIFSSPVLKRDTERATLLGFAADPYGFGRNDLQSVARSLNPDVTQALEWLGTAGKSKEQTGKMTGSGSAVFARWAQADHPAAPAGWQVRICSNMDVHPLAGWATSED
jgi:4-diphosphocytidyl-2-C-methyl-D-erythritol kinase